MKRINQNRLSKVSWWWGCYGTTGMAYFLDKDNIVITDRILDDERWYLRETKYGKSS